MFSKILNRYNSMTIFLFISMYNSTYVYIYYEIFCCVLILSCHIFTLLNFQFIFNILFIDDYYFILFLD